MSLHSNLFKQTNIFKSSNLFESIQENLQEAEDLDKCIKDYSEYVDAHIQNVMKAWTEEVSKIDDEFIQTHLDEILEKVKNHDLSKWSNEEFDAYRANYNPINDEEKINNEANFQAAWWHHFQNNGHHWQHWTGEDGELLPIEDIDKVKLAYVEMICDWQAMGYVFGDTAKQYYDSNKDTIKIYPELQEWLEDLLNKLENLEVEDNGTEERNDS